ncbi:MAG: xanthine dehydrogenase accessory protein XdhC, partial [Rickettsiales bacterium]
MSHPNHSWLPVLAELTEKGTPCVLITVMEARGSTPREAGTKMVVTADAQFGTIGGGNLEFDATREARALLETAQSQPAQKRYALGPTLAQCCGGSVSVLLEPFLGCAKRLFLFGAGHVGRELVQVLSALPVKVIWVDEREQEFPDTLPSICDKRCVDAPVSVLDEAKADDYIVIMTHSHDLDYALVETA